ncbi:uncharacterized protein LOC125675812 isoform X2 [Ostrea edulis]|uniref:uncharacterized protein LOC125675812 isoform X2 n=1 Tax=Ostrea edulis TaxID=37623 RepID=UPI0024AF5C2A|nr:uncharacterized protein LOC125675812 isoform X2 [Ostrea edulis]
MYTTGILHVYDTNQFSSFFFILLISFMNLIFTFFFFVENQRAELRRRRFGEYNTWKTPISDQFSSLSDDEVWVLFCFLCSDSGTPNFTDTDCLDILNKIREMYREDRVTSEKAQRTLDRLNSRGFIWNQDGVDITEDAKDETVYRVTGRVIERVTGLSDRLPVSLLHLLPSYTTAVRYLRSHRYTRESGEKCLISVNSSCDSLLIRRLQMNILTHVTMEDTTICDEVSQYLNIPLSKVRMSDDARGALLEELHRTGERVQYRGGSQGSVQHVKWLWIYGRPDIVRSCIGLHPHWDIYIINNTAYRKHSQHHDRPPAERCLLYCLLMVDDYTVKVKDESHIKMYNAIRERYFTSLPVCDEITATNSPEEILQTENDVIKFKSDDIRHDVMYAFVTECLVEDSDLKFFLTTASRHMISEYCRSWDYKRSEGERCLYIPNNPDEMCKLFIDRLQLDILTHCTVSDRMIHDSITKRLGVPEEILNWDQEARERYVEYAKRGTQTVHHARGMIVGCAGAGKTTLLKRLLRCSDADIMGVTSTKGLEVHEEIFEICNNELKAKAGDGRQMPHHSHLNRDMNDSKETTKKLVSFVDFGGQCAYYACHQIYLTRRAFYLLVIDASKRLKDVVDNRVCDQEGTVFAGWTYERYFLFWLESIQTYCSQEDEKDKDVDVVIVATHWDKGIYKEKTDFLDVLHKSLPPRSTLGQYIREDRSFCTSFPIQPLSDLSRFLTDLATNENKWSEMIPNGWTFLSNIIQSERKIKRILTLDDILQKMETYDERKGERAADMLRYYHDAGKVLYFQEEGLKDSVIIDVQWFIDSFKTVITDKNHRKGIKTTTASWDEYYETGHLEDDLLDNIWKKEDEELKAIYDPDTEELNPRFRMHHKKTLLTYMERLGLISVGRDSHYVPCMNKKPFGEDQKRIIKNSVFRTPVLVFCFDFLPYFLFYRLVVKLMQVENWKVLENEGISCLYNSAAMFEFQSHRIAVAVTSSTIQIQIYKVDSKLSKDFTVSVREIIESAMDELTQTFHGKNIKYIAGFSCEQADEQVVGLDLKKNFIKENELQAGESMPCPRHQMETHKIHPDYLTRYWKGSN